MNKNLIFNNIVNNIGNVIFIEKLVQAFFGFILTLSVAITLDSNAQGSYYFISSVTALLLISDLGFSNISFIFLSTTKKKYRYYLYLNIIKKYFFFQ